MKEEKRRNKKEEDNMRKETNRYLDTIEELEIEKSNMTIMQLEENNKEIMKLNKILEREREGQGKKIEVEKNGTTTR